MTSKRYFFVMCALLFIMVGLLIGVAVGGNKILEKQSQKLQSLKAENQAVDLQQNALIQAKKDVERFAEIDQITRSIVPKDKDQAKTVREIVQIAEANRIKISTITFPNSTLGNAAPAPSAAPAAGEGGAAAAPKVQPPASQLAAVQGIPGVFTLQIKVDSAGSVNYQSFLRFLEGLEKNRRTAHVSTVNVEPSEDGGSLKFSLTLNAYVKP